MNRRNQDEETWYRLREWQRGQPASQRLAAHILQAEGFIEVQPIHPLGGPDDGQDIVAERAGKKYVGAVYFPRGQQSFSAIQKKFDEDATKLDPELFQGFAFITNQEVTLSQRKELIESLPALDVQLYHLETINHILNTPGNYGIRLQFLEIEMTKEEQLSFIDTQKKEFQLLNDKVNTLSGMIQNVPDKVKESLDLQSSPTTTVAAIDLTTFPFKRIHHRCTICGHGFVVQINEFGFSLGKSTGQGAPCPVCKNVDLL